MHKRSSAILRATLLAVIVGIATPGLAAPPEGKGGGKDKGSASPVISVEWRRDVWQAPEIRTMDENGHNMFKVSSDPDLKRGGWPRWSPDGLRVGGYYKRFGDGSDYGMMSIAADGTDEQLILLGSEFEAFNEARGFRGSVLSLAAWSPDGKSMVFSGRVTYPKELFNPVPAYDVTVGRLFTVRPVDGTITISPVTDVPDATDIAGTDHELLEYDDFHPHWSSALNKIVFVSNRTGSADLWVIDPDGTNLQQITALGLRAMYYPVWSHGGDPFAGIASIAVSVDLGNPSPVRFFATDRDLWILDIDLNAQDPITNVTVVVRADPEFIEGLAAWSPDDSRLVIARRTDANSRNSRTQIVIVDLATDAEKTLVDSTKQAVLFPDWNPVPPSP